jgi:nitrogen regulatory protein PII
MKAIFIAYDQAHYERIIEILSHLNCRGFTRFEEVQGRGSRTGDPHFGSHAWPSMCSAILAIVEDHSVRPVLDALRKLDLQADQLGLRAFVWNVEDSV